MNGKHYSEFMCNGLQNVEDITSVVIYTDCCDDTFYNNQLICLIITKLKVKT